MSTRIYTLRVEEVIDGEQYYCDRVVPACMFDEAVHKDTLLLNEYNILTRQFDRDITLGDRRNISLTETIERQKAQLKASSASTVDIFSVQQKSIDSLTVQLAASEFLNCENLALITRLKKQLDASNFVVGTLMALKG